MRQAFVSLISLSALAMMAQANAAVRHYMSDIERSDWTLSTKTRLACTLEHALPGYGKAMFTSEASKQLNMEFELSMRMLPKHFAVAAVYAEPPTWAAGETPRPIADMQLRTQYNGDLPEQAAWTMLSELEKGYWPSLYYKDWYNPYDHVKVSLNASNFMPVYREFVECVSNLLPFSFEDIAYTVLTYELSSVELTKYSQKRLAMIGEYLKEDTDMELVLLDGYADSYGGQWSNQQLSERRAGEIKAFFTSMGVDANRITITGHGEKRHIAPNRTAEDRALNRRVVVRLSKD